MRLACILLFTACTGSNESVLNELDGVDAALDSPDSSMSQQPWTNVTSNTTVDLYGVWAGSATNVVAVGGKPGDTAGNPGLILRYDGASWARSPNLLNLLGVFGRTAVGEYGGEGSYTYWDGTAWSSRFVLQAGSLRGTWETSTGTYAVGDNGRLHYESDTGNAGSWQTLTSNTTNALYAVWGSTESDVYAVGAGGVILHNSNAAGGAGTWTKTTHGSSTLRAIWGTSPNNMYIVGEAPAVILHSTNGGTTWTEAQLPASAIGLSGIAGTSANDIYVVGATGGLAFHSTGNDVWTTQMLPATYDMFGIAIASSGDIYAVGRNGTIYHKAP